MEMLVPRGAARVQLERQQVFTVAAEIEAPLPKPPEWPKGTAARTGVICVEVVVSDEGDVASVTLIEPEPACDHAGSAAAALFFPSVRNTVSTWQYLAASICDYTADPMECGGPAATIRRIPIKLAYRFDFSTDAVVFSRSLLRRR